MRDKTERPEAVAVGTVKLVGTNPDRITEAASQLLDNPEMRRAMSRIHNPYGDGQASGRIADAIRTFFES
jgi:UDP-N-acetylglucosamine 2-epimerase (non-hydrolysing)